MYKTEINQQENIMHHQYGLLSMLALIVGMVIGSGIYIVNDKLYSNSYHSTGLSMIAWLLISLVVLFMLIAFIEIASITALSGEPGTLNNWNRHLWGEKTSKYVGMFFAFIYLPVMISGLAMIMASQILADINLTPTVDNGMSHSWSTFGYSLLLGLIIINLIFAMNTLTMQPGKVFQATGTGIKLIPLFTIIIIGVLAISGLFVDSGDSNNVFQIAPQDGTSLEDKKLFFVVLLLTPTIMFSYDGFLFAASLQNEAKKSSTYKTSAISGILFIILVYLLVSFFSFKFGDPSGTNGFSVTNTLTTIFPSASNWITPIFSTMIVISIITGLSGYTISANRTIADLSANNELRDSEGKLVARNKALIPQGASILMWIMVIIVFLTFRSVDALSIWAFNKDYNNGVISSDFSFYPIQSWTIDLVTLIAYCFYIFIIIGAIKNRFSKQVEVEKSKAFLPAAFISVIVVGVILLAFSYSIFVPPDFKVPLNSDFYNTNALNNNVADQKTSIYLITTYTLQLLVTIVIISLIFVVPYLLEKNVRKMSKEEKEQKNLLVKAYREREVAPQYLK